MIVLADRDPRFQSRVSDYLGRKDKMIVVDDLAQLEKVLGEKVGKIDVVILGPNLPVEECYQVAQRMQASMQPSSVVLIAQALTAEVFQGAMRSGIRDVLPATFTGPQLVEAVTRAEGLAEQMRGAAKTAAEAPAAAAAAQGRVITIFSSKGGCGKSFVASNLAVALSMRTGEEVAMIDLDLQFGDLAIMLQLFPARTIFDAAQNLDRLDTEALRGYLTPHRSKVFLLAAPVEPGLSETISADAVVRIIRLMKQAFKYVIVDTPPSFTDHVLAALDESNECILITSMDVPSIKNMKLSLQTLQLLGYGRDRLRIALNRADSKVGLTVQAVEKTLGTTVDVSIPSSRDVSVSINRGAPLVVENPKSPVVTSILRMLDLMGIDVEGSTAHPAPQEEPSPRGLFRMRKSKFGGG